MEPVPGTASERPKLGLALAAPFSHGATKRVPLLASSGQASCLCWSWVPNPPQALMGRRGHRRCRRRRSPNPCSFDSCFFTDWIQNTSSALGLDPEQTQTVPVPVTVMTPQRMFAAWAPSRSAPSDVLEVWSNSSVTLYRDSRPSF